MALVVTARPPAADTSAGSVVTPAPALAPWRTAAAATAVVYALAMTFEATARALPLTAGLDTAVVVANVLAGILTLTVSAGTWLARRDDGGLLLAATLATVLAGLRPVATAL